MTEMTVAHWKSAAKKKLGLAVLAEGLKHTERVLAGLEVDDAEPALQTVMRDRIKLVKAFLKNQDQTVLTTLVKTGELSPNFVNLVNVGRGHHETLFQMRRRTRRMGRDFAKTKQNAQDAIIQMANGDQIHG